MNTKHLKVIRSKLKMCRAKLKMIRLFHMNIDKNKEKLPLSIIFLSETFGMQYRYILAKFFLSCTPFFYWNNSRKRLVKDIS